MACTNVGVSSLAAAAGAKRWVEGSVGVAAVVADRFVEVSAG
jgi:hypothetical protein